MTVEEYTKIIKDKLKTNDDIIKFTYFEVRIKYNLNKKETEEFLKAVKNTLKNKGYKVYLEGETYEYLGSKKVVENNELMVAII